MALFKALLALALGIVLWMPIALMLHGVSGLGRGANGWETIATLVPPALVYGPSIVRSLAAGKLDEACFAFAGTPVLALLGAVCMFVLEATVFAGLHVGMGEAVSSLCVVVISAAVALGLRRMNRAECAIR